MEKDISKDPSGHIKIAVSDIEKSKIFYTEIFDKLGFNQVSNKEKSAGWVTKQGFGIWISQAGKKQPAYTFSAPGLHHFCIKAESKEEVNAVFELIKNKVHVFDPPQAYPEYAPKYYAVFFADPDGIKLEVAYY